MSLTKNFQENGYLIIKNFFNKKNCDFLYKKMKKYANKDFAPIMNPDRPEFLISQTADKMNKIKYLRDKANYINSIKRDCDYFRKIMINKKILQILEKIKKKKIKVLMSQMIFKEKKTNYASQSWQPHQDNSYPKNKNGHYITINIFLRNSDISNGTLYIYEKSHKYGILDFSKKVSYREKDFKPGNTVKKLPFRKRNLNFRRGDLLVLHGNLVHGSYPNKSSKSRPLYSVSYIPKGEKFISGLNAQRKILN